MCYVIYKVATLIFRLTKKGDKSVIQYSTIKTYKID